MIAPVAVAAAPAPAPPAEETTFVITSGATTITGTRTLATRGWCLDARREVDYLHGGWGTYTATIRVVTGSGATATETTYADHGYSDLNMDEDSVLMRATFLPVS